MTRTTMLRISDFRIAFLVGILSKKRSREKLVQHPIISPASKESTKTV
jgi:hypothetical protein